MANNQSSPYNLSEAQDTGVRAIESDGITKVQTVNTENDKQEINVFESIHDKEKCKTLATSDLATFVSHHTKISLSDLQYTEVFETTVAKLALKTDDTLVEVIKPTDLSNIKNHAAWFCSNDYLAGFPGFLVVDYRSLNSKQRSAICTTFRKHYPELNTFTLEELEEQVAGFNGYITGHIRRANFNNLIFFSIPEFFSKVFPELEFK